MKGQAQPFDCCWLWHVCHTSAPLSRLTVQRKCKDSQRLHPQWQDQQQGGDVVVISYRFRPILCMPRGLWGRTPVVNGGLEELGRESEGMTATDKSCMFEQDARPCSGSITTIWGPLVSTPPIAAAVADPPFRPPWNVDQKRKEAIPKPQMKASSFTVNAIFTFSCLPGWALMNWVRTGYAAVRIL